MSVYCINKWCKGRRECAKAQEKKAGDKEHWFVNGYYSYRCKDFEELPKVNK